MEVDEAPEHVHARDAHVVSDTNEADVPAWASRVDGLHHRFLRANGLHYGVGSEPVRELLDHGHAILAALLDDVRRAVVAGETLARFMAAHDDDPIRAELAGSEHCMQANRAITHHRHGLARTGPGRHGAEPAGAKNVGR